MFNLKVENAKGQILQLSQNESKYQILNIEGLTPPNASIFTSPIVNVNGEKYKSSKVEMRNIVLTLRVNGEVEKNRIALYQFFRTSKKCTLFYSNGTRDVYIDCYCEAFEGDFFTQSQELQISLICPSPFFKDVDLILYDFSKTVAMFTFPFAIDNNGVPFSDLQSEKVTSVINNGEVATGLLFTIVAMTDEVLNPTIYNVETGEYFRVETIMNKSDTLIINTNKGEKSVTKIINGIKRNEINNVSGSSTWLQLENGIHDFTYNTDSFDSELKVTVEFNTLYEGV